MKNYGEVLYKPFFIFKGINSLDMGIIVTSMPAVVRPKRRVDTVTIQGRNGVLHVDDNSYENYTKTVECAIMNRKGIDEIAAWLVGTGEAIFSTEPDKIYRVRVDNQIDINQMLNVFQKFQVNFDTYPFKYSVNCYDDTVSLIEEKSLYNRGTIYSEPKITVYGNGAVVLTINDVDYGLSNVNGYITIDSEIMEVYKDNVNKNADYTPPEVEDRMFPILEVGENTIEWTGTVERIEIVPRWRWL